MLEELKKLNYLGTKEDIIFFLTSIIGKQKLSQRDIYSVCKHAPGNFLLNADALLSYSLYLNLITVDDKISLCPTIENLLANSIEINNYIIGRTISKMFEENIFESDMFSYDVLDNRFVFKNEKLSLKYSFIRNILVGQGFFIVNRSNGFSYFYVAEQYESLLSSFCKKNKRNITIEQLRKQIEANNEAGEKAECFVLAYEQNRITNPLLKKQIKKISDIDVGAGYDIVSFDSNDSKSLDRFIEVKAVSASSSFFWSKNEHEVATLKGNQYFLYLVDLQKTKENDYIPKIICNPANAILKSNDWLIEPQSYHIWHV